MATLINPFSLKMRFQLFSSLLFILISCFVKRSNGFEGRKLDGAIDSHFHSVEISSFFPSDVCSRSTTIKGSNSIVPSLNEVLSLDKARVDYIQARLDPKKQKISINLNLSSNSNELNNDEKANLPVQSGQSLGTGNYIVTVGLGTPKSPLSLEFDTGSDLTWTQCQPCVQSCYKQHDPIFNPLTSTSFTNVSCNSAECSQLSATGNSPSCASTTCVYSIKYGDQSFSEGFFSRDKLTISATDVFPSFLFGCGQNNRGLFGETAGLLGLDRNAISFVSQTAQTYGKYFSYCLPSSPSQTGHLTFGRAGAPTQVKFTPLDTSRGTSFYFIDIVSISVGGSQLPIQHSVFQTAGGIIDSGTVITRLPPAAYKEVSAAFRRLMAKYPTAPGNSLLDTCYDLSGYTTVSIPLISFTFAGDVKLDLGPTGILIVEDISRVCLAFAGNTDPSTFAIYGNIQQKTFEVVYDVDAGKVGFAPGGCK